MENMIKKVNETLSKRLKTDEIITLQLDDKIVLFVEKYTTNDYCIELLDDEGEILDSCGFNFETEDEEDFKLTISRLQIEYYLKKYRYKKALETIKVYSICSEIEQQSMKERFNEALEILQELVNKNGGIN